MSRPFPTPQLPSPPNQLKLTVPHNLRHTAATIMFARGLALAEVSRTLGHSSIVITMDLYVHWIPTD